MGSDVSFVSAGDDHTCAIKKAKLYCWGENAHGRLGNGDTTDQRQPVAVKNMGSDISSVSAGGAYTCAIKSAKLYCWGAGFSGQLGQGDSHGDLEATAVTDMGSDVSSISAGDSHTCAIKSGALYAWGNVGDSRLGRTIYQNSTPKGVGDMGSGVSSFSAGDKHTCAIKSGALYCWGNNEFGQIGNGATSTSSISTSTIVSNMGSGVSSVAAGAEHTCAIKSAKLYCWGRAAAGRLGEGSTGGGGSTRNEPAAVTDMGSGVSSVSAGEKHTCAIKSGKLYCWGDNGDGRLGDGTSGGRKLTPFEINL